jgi:hypothetical protein
MARLAAGAALDGTEVRLEVDIRYGKAVGVADDVGDASRPSKVAGTGDLRSCAAGQQQGGEKDQQRARNKPTPTRTRKTKS